MPSKRPSSSTTLGHLEYASLVILILHEVEIGQILTTNLSQPFEKLTKGNRTDKLITNRKEIRLGL